MKLHVLTAILGLLATPALVSAEEPKEISMATELVSQVTVEGNAIGTLRYCDKQGLAKTINEQAVQKILSKVLAAESDAEKGQAIFIRAVRGFEMYTVGVTNGLKIARLSEENKVITCMAGSELADEILSEGYAPSN